MKVMKNGVCESAGIAKAFAEAGNLKLEMIVIVVLRECWSLRYTLWIRFGSWWQRTLKLRLQIPKQRTSGEVLLCLLPGSRLRMATFSSTIVFPVRRPQSSVRGVHSGHRSGRELIIIFTGPNLKLILSATSVCHV